MHVAVELPTYVNQAKKLKLSDYERELIVTHISFNPRGGEVISGTGGVRKVRVPLADKGKSGGYRVISYYCGEDAPVILISIFKKTKQLSLTSEDKNRMKVLTQIIDSELKGRKA